jgi:hypothetical protein
MNTNSPVFVFSAGWRSGSTLLQRLITATQEVLVWGEAGGALECFADAWSRYEQMLGPGGTRYRHGFGGNGSQEFEAFVEAGDEGINNWIACMNPPAEHIRAALLAAFDRMYGEPSRELGYSRWGVKEVRSGIDTASFITGIFPSAKFVFLVRHPFACLESIKRRGWIDSTIHDDPLGFFAVHWATLAKQFRSANFGMTLKFEELTSSDDIVFRLAEYLEVKNIAPQFPRQSRADWNAVTEEGLTRWEKRRLLKNVEEEMLQWGYGPDGGTA